jgi:hypothetical protein
MKALTIMQPTAAAVILGHKDVENRSWSTKYRGPFLVHAGRSWDDVSERYYRRWLRRRGTSLELSDPLLRHGVLLGTCVLVDVVRDSSSTWAMDDLYHWVLGDARPFDEPIPAKGAQGWWTYEGRVPASVNQPEGSPNG